MVVSLLANLSPETSLKCGIGGRDIEHHLVGNVIDTICPELHKLGN